MSGKHPLTTPLIKENPVTLNVLGVCAALAITNSLTNSLVMSAALTSVLVLSNASISLVHRLLPSSVRLIVQITVIASAVTVIDQFLKAFLPDAAARLSVYVALIITNCIVLGRTESFAMNNSPYPSVLDGLGNALGYAVVLVVVAFARELFGAGKVLGFTVLPLAKDGGWYVPNGLMMLAPSALFLIGLLIWALRTWKPQLQEKD